MGVTLGWQRDAMDLEEELRLLGTLTIASLVLGVLSCAVAVFMPRKKVRVVASMNAASSFGAMFFFSWVHAFIRKQVKQEKRQ